MDAVEVKPLGAAESAPVLRLVRALNLAGVEPHKAPGADPVFEWIDPKTLLVDEVYQRSLSDRSIVLIRKIVSQWDWRRFKPPICARTDAGLEVIDGQHTALAAATHPEVFDIPVMIVDAADQGARARAFVGHNRDRLGITPAQIHFAALAAGDEDAQTIDQVCARAGVKILRTAPAHAIFKPGQTLAISAISALINRRGAMKARQVLQVLAEGRCAPVSVNSIKAAEMVLFGAEYAASVEAANLVSAIVALGPTAEQEAKVFAAAHKVPVWRALGIVWFRRVSRGRRRAS